MRKYDDRLHVYERRQHVRGGCDTGCGGAADSRGLVPVTGDVDAAAGGLGVVRADTDVAVAGERGLVEIAGAKVVLA